MENASKALIMAAEVLIGVIIISIGVALFTIFSNYSKDTVEELNASQIAMFNNNFLKFEDKDLTAHDIVTIANFAKENNIKYELYTKEGTSTKENNQGLYYVQIDVEKESEHMETYDEKQFSEFMEKKSLVEKDGKYDTKYYVCYQGRNSNKKSTIKISDITKRVIYIKFLEKDEN